MDGPSPSIPVLYTVCISNAIHNLRDISNAILFILCIEISNAIYYNS